MNSKQFHQNTKSLGRETQTQVKLGLDLIITLKRYQAHKTK